MATINPEELLRLWSAEKLTSEMAIGHLLQNLVLQQSSIGNLQASIASLRAEVQKLSGPEPDEPPSAPRKPSQKPPRRR